MKNASNEGFTIKRLTNKRLVSCLMDNRKLSFISISGSEVLCQCKKNFMPSDLEALKALVGHSNPKLATQEGVNYIIFNRF